jgi:hypoxanthine-DNA glycosylase
MKGKSTFTRAEADQIIKLIRQKLKADSTAQKGIRNKIRDLRFYATDFGIGGGYTEQDFLRVVKIIGEAPKQEAKPLPEVSTQPKTEKMAVNTLHKVSFPPISNSEARILVLGTMPGEKSLALNQYYGHGGNQFWKIMFECFNIPYSEDYNEKKQLLLDNRIALWDVLQFCEREGSSDNNIKAEIPNDFDSFFKDHPKIKTVLFNGNNAKEYYEKHIGLDESKQSWVLPSTSPMNTWMTREEKMVEWKTLIDKTSQRQSSF